MNLKTLLIKKINQYILRRENKIIFKFFKKWSIYFNKLKTIETKLQKTTITSINMNINYLHMMNLISKINTYVEDIHSTNSINKDFDYIDKSSSISNSNIRNKYSYKWYEKFNTKKSNKDILNSIDNQNNDTINLLDTKIENISPLNKSIISPVSYSLLKKITKIN